MTTTKKSRARKASTSSTSNTPRYSAAASKRVESALHREKKATLKSGAGRKRRHGEDPRAGHRHRSVRSAESRRQGSAATAKARPQHASPARHVNRHQVGKSRRKQFALNDHPIR